MAPKFVEPGADEMPRIKAERAQGQGVCVERAGATVVRRFSCAGARAADRQLRHAAHVQRRAGQRSQGNGFSRGHGTPVRAGNSGVVVLARPLYYEGNCVVIDHGLGLFTISMHLSRIDVHEGDHVIAGQLLGLSGATGRVTGPHLHWAVRWQNAYLDPAKMLRMDLSDSALARKSLLFGVA